MSLTALSPRIDIQRQAVGAGALSLHEDQVPLRNKGSGSKRLIATAMQMKLHGGKNISLIDEIELGLEPHRIRGLLYRLRNAGQQIFATTHSPVVIRELNVGDDELYACKRDAAGTVTLESLAIVPGIQGRVGANAEAFLGSKIIACEGPTEIGCLRAYDLYRLDQASPPIWTLATAYFDCGGASGLAPACPQRRRETARPTAASGSRDRQPPIPRSSSREPSTPSRLGPSTRRHGSTSSSPPPEPPAECRNGSTGSSSRPSSVDMTPTRAETWPPQCSKRKIPPSGACAQAMTVTSRTGMTS